jgi:hypothetical protein
MQYIQQNSKTISGQKREGTSRRPRGYFWDFEGYFWETQRVLSGDGAGTSGRRKGYFWETNQVLLGDDSSVENRGIPSHFQPFFFLVFADYY